MQDQQQHNQQTADPKQDEDQKKQQLQHYLTNNSQQQQSIQNQNENLKVSHTHHIGQVLYSQKSNPFQQYSSVTNLQVSSHRNTLQPGVTYTNLIKSQQLSSPVQHQNLSSTSTSQQNIQLSAQHLNMAQNPTITTTTIGQQQQPAITTTTTQQHVRYGNLYQQQNIPLNSKSVTITQEQQQPSVSITYQQPSVSISQQQLPISVNQEYQPNGTVSYQEAMLGYNCYIKYLEQQKKTTVASPQRVSVIRATSPQRQTIVSQSRMQVTSPQVLRSTSPQIIRSISPGPVQKVQYSQQQQSSHQLSAQISQQNSQQTLLIQQLQSKIQQLESTIISQKDIQDMENRTEELLKDNKELHLNIEKLINENSRLLEVIEDNKLQLKNKELSDEQVIMLGVELERMHLVLNDKNNEYCQLENENSHLNIQMQELNVALNQSIEDHKIQIEKNEHLQMHIEGLQNEIKELTDKLQNAMEFEFKYKENEDKIQILVQEIERLKQVLDKQDQELEGLQAQNSQQEHQIHEYHKQEDTLREYENRIALLTQEVQRLNGVVEEKTVQYSEGQQEMQQHYESIIQELRIKEEELMVQVNEYKVTIEQKTVSIETNRDEAEKLNDRLKKQIEINEMQLGELKDSNQEIEKLKQDLMNLKVVNAKLQSTQTVKVQQIPTSQIVSSKVTSNLATISPQQRLSMVPSTTYQHQGSLIDNKRMTAGPTYSSIQQLHSQGSGLQLQGQNMGLQLQNQQSGLQLQGQTSGGLQLASQSGGLQLASQSGGLQTGSQMGMRIGLQRNTSNVGNVGHIRSSSPVNDLSKSGTRYSTLTHNQIIGQSRHQ